MKTLERPPGFWTTKCGRRISRRRLLRIGGASVAGAALFGVGCGGEAGQSEASGETRTIEHALGTTEVPARPQIYMILDNTVSIGYAASVGMLPAFAIEQDLGRAQPFPEDLYPDAEEVEPISGDFGSASLETVARANPDLIVAAAGYVDDVYDELTRIAPTVSLEYGFQDPWSDMRLFAEALGVPRRVDEAKCRVDDEIARAKERVSGEGRTMSFGAAWEDGSIMIYEPIYYLPILAAKELGFEPVPDFADFADIGGSPGEGRVNLSAERVTELSGDYVILLQATNSADESAALDEILDGPLFQRLPAVENDRVLVMSRLTALGAAGVDGWLDQLDELVAFLEESGQGSSEEMR